MTKVKVVSLLEKYVGKVHLTYVCILYERHCFKDKAVGIIDIRYYDNIVDCYFVENI